MRNILFNDGSFILFFLNENLRDIKNGKILEDFLLTEDRKKLNQLKIFKSDEGIFKEGFLRINPFIITLSKKKPVEIILSERCINYLEDSSENGNIGLFYGKNHINIYSENYACFDSMYNIL